MDVTITKLTDPAELHQHYPGQHQQQPCILVLDLEDGEMTCRYNPEIGNGIPASVFHRRTLWIPIPCLTADAANRLMEHATPLAQRILDGSEIVWDGNNHAGRLDDDAWAAHEQLAEECAPESGTWDPSQLVAEYDAEYWYTPDLRDETIERLGLTADTTDAELAAMAEAEERDASSMGSDAGHVILVGAEAWLTMYRDELRDAVREELERTAGQLVEIERLRDAGVRRLATWGDSSRAIGAVVGLSHTRVQQIVKEAAPTG